SSSLGNSLLSFFAGTTIVRSFFIVMKVHSFLTHSYVGTTRINPGPTVVVIDAVSHSLHRVVSVTAEDPLRVGIVRVSQGAFGDFIGRAHAACVQPVEEADKGLALVVYFLEMKIDEFTDAAEEEIIDDETVELVAVNRQMANSLILPYILPINR